MLFRIKAHAFGSQEHAGCISRVSDHRSTCKAAVRSEELHTYDCNEPYDVILFYETVFY